MFRNFIFSCFLWLCLSGCASTTMGTQDTFNEKSPYGLAVLSVDMSENAQKSFFITNFGRGEKADLVIQWMGDKKETITQDLTPDNVIITNKEHYLASEIFLKSDKSDVRESLAIKDPAKKIFFIVVKINQDNIYHLDNIHYYDSHTINTGTITPSNPFGIPDFPKYTISSNTINIVSPLDQGDCIRNCIN